jgi:hypothetical protein
MIKEEKCYYCGNVIAIGEVYTRATTWKNENVCMHVPVDCPVNRKDAIASKEREMENERKAS